MRPQGLLRTRWLSRVLIGTLTLVAITVCLGASSVAQSEGVLHVFTGSDGNNPYGGLVFDAAGNLYGTTSRVVPTILARSSNCPSVKAVA